MRLSCLPSLFLALDRFTEEACHWFSSRPCSLQSWKAFVLFKASINRSVTVRFAAGCWASLYTMGFSLPKPLKSSHVITGQLTGTFAWQGSPASLPFCYCQSNTLIGFSGTLHEGSCQIITFSWKGLLWLTHPSLPQLKNYNQLKQINQNGRRSKLNSTFSFTFLWCLFFPSS